MRRSQRLQTVKTFLARQEESATKAMTRAMAEVEKAQRQLEALRNFRRDYMGRMRQNGVMNARLLHEYRTFLDSLARAIEEQEQVLRNMRQRHAALEQEWRQVHRRLRSVGTFQERLERQEFQARERRLQAELDDRSAVRHRNKAGWK